MPLSHRYFVASIGLYVASMISGLLIWALDSGPLLAIAPLILLALASAAMLVAIEAREAEKAKG